MAEIDWQERQPAPAKTRYFSSQGFPIRATKSADALAALNNYTEISKEEYHRLVLERNERTGHSVKTNLNWETFQALTKHAKANKVKPADLASGIISQYYETEANTRTVWRTRES